RDGHGQLGLAAERDEGGDRHAAARPAVEAGTRPDLAPGVARDQVLEVGGEVGRAGDRAVDVLVAEHLTPRRHAVVHRASSWRASARSTSSSAEPRYDAASGNGPPAASNSSATSPPDHYPP